MDQFAVYFKAVCGRTVTGRVGVSAFATRWALFTDGTYRTHGTNVMAPSKLKPGMSCTDY
jgi:hypothetical protein